MRKNFVMLLAVLAASLLAGCAHVQMESADADAVAKKFSAPADGKAGIYVYRAGNYGGSLKKALYIDDNCLGVSAPNMFLYEQVTGNTEHKISTQSEFSPNDLVLTTQAGKNYFIHQYIKMGVFVGGANLELVEEDKGKEIIEKLNLAKKGICNQ